jgi:hypothetical protein
MAVLDWKIGSRTRSQFVQNLGAICKNLWNLLDLRINFLLKIPWTGFITCGPGLRHGFSGPPWTGGQRERRARRSITGRPVPRAFLHREWGERGRRPSGSSPEADGGGATTSMSGGGDAWSSSGGQHGRGWSESMRGPGPWCGGGALGRLL